MTEFLAEYGLFLLKTVTIVIAIVAIIGSAAAAQKKAGSSLSVTEEYLALEGGPPIFKQDFTCPALLENFTCFYLYGTITLYG